MRDADPSRLAAMDAQRLRLVICLLSLLFCGFLGTLAYVVFVVPPPPPSPPPPRLPLAAVDKDATKFKGKVRHGAAPAHDGGNDERGGLEGELSRTRNRLANIEADFATMQRAQSKADAMRSTIATSFTFQCVDERRRLFAITAPKFAALCASSLVRSRVPAGRGAGSVKPRRLMFCHCFLRRFATAGSKLASRCGGRGASPCSSRSLRPCPRCSWRPRC